MFKAVRYRYNIIEGKYQKHIKERPEDEYGELWKKHITAFRTYCHWESEVEDEEQYLKDHRVLKKAINYIYEYNLQVL